MHVKLSIGLKKYPLRQAEQLLPVYPEEQLVQAEELQAKQLAPIPVQGRQVPPLLL